MQKISYDSGNAINFLKQGIILSLLILLNLAAYSNPMSENTERKADCNFLSGKPAFTSFDQYLKNNPPEEASNTARSVCFYTLSSNTGSASATVGSGNFSVTVLRHRMSIVV